MSKTTFYDTKEEKINVISHFVGLLLSIAALALLVVKASLMGNVWHIVSFSVYGLSLIVLYLASTLYHNSKNPIKRAKLNIFDHAAIYVLIAGSYTPFTLVTLNGTVGWVLFGLTWGAALAGVVFKIFFIGNFDKLSTVLYVLMGWMVVFAMKPLYENLSQQGLFWLIMGGVFYTVGAVFYAQNKLKFNHAIFHIFVLLGSASHFVSIFFFV
ncbi:MAG: hemolysin III family protein [Flavobacteriaceae bacterium]|nr:hemolysin III family protein [Flavobacteriaceae bacterium]